MPSNKVPQPFKKPWDSKQPTFRRIAAGCRSRSIWHGRNNNQKDAAREVDGPDTGTSAKRKKCVICKRCVTILVYESHAYDSSYRRASYLAERDLAPHGHPDGTPHSRTARNRQSEGRKAAISSPCRGDWRRPAKCFFSQGIFALMKGIADTGFIVAFARRNDEHHVWAVDVAKRITEPLLTCEAVLAEAAFQLESVSYVLSLLQDEMLRLVFDCNRNIGPLAELARRYSDRNPDLADLCLIRMSELYPGHIVLTVDNDFRVYRRNRREAIPIHMPPYRR